MCIHPEDPVAQYRGICIDCEKVEIKNWNEIPDFNHHHLTKVHIYPEDIWSKTIKSQYPKWKGNMSYDSKTGYSISYYEDSVYKTVQVPPRPNYECLCCPH
jgi:hypothetical protein